MSEYQYVTFRAIDRPVSEKDLRYMEKQSSRAHITKWEFSNEYHFGDFRGNALEMLRRGYDIHLHYANFGTRTLMMRLPTGFPDEKLAKKYLDGDSLRFERDKNTAGGSLIVEPAYEPGELDDLWNIEELVDELVPLRAELLAGDLRPLYLARLAIGRDMNHDRDEILEVPTPAGLNKLTDAQRALAELYGLSDSLIAAAAHDSPSLRPAQDLRTTCETWIRSYSTKIKDHWLTELLSDPQALVRDEMQVAFRKDYSPASWPVAYLNRSMTQLENQADEIDTLMASKAAEKAARQRVKKMATMAANPVSVLRDAEKLVETFSTSAYKQVAELLADLREALAGTDKAGLAEAHAQKLRRDFPTKTQLGTALKRAGFCKQPTAKRKSAKH